MTVPNEGNGLGVENMKCDDAAWHYGGDFPIILKELIKQDGFIF